MDGPLNTAILEYLSGLPEHKKTVLSICSLELDKELGVVRIVENKRNNLNYGCVLYNGSAALDDIFEKVRTYEEKFNRYVIINNFDSLNQLFSVPRLKRIYETGKSYTRNNTEEKTICPVLDQEEIKFLANE